MNKHGHEQLKIMKSHDVQYVQQKLQAKRRASPSYYGMEGASQHGGRVLI